ncbi:MAG: pirin family protein [Myxococcaceae bacterium]
MSFTSRRTLLAGSGLLVASSILGCKSNASRAPTYVSTAQRKVQQVVGGLPSMDGAGVRLRKVLGQPALRNLDPFLMLDRFHSSNPDDYIRGFPNHPHRGFETITVMLSGQMRHRDSVGNQGLIVGGGAQWMTAGRGIIHSEMPEPQVGGLMSGMQLWLNLPAKEKMSQQAYHDLTPSVIAEGSLNRAGSRIRVITGEVNGLVGPVPDRSTQPLLLTAFLEDDQPFELETPAGHAAFVFVASGSVEVGPENGTQTVGEGALAVLSPGNRARVRATNQRSEILLAAARPLREPIVQRGPFVMNTEQEIRQAIADYRAGVLDRT